MQLQLACRWVFSIVFAEKPFLNCEIGIITHTQRRQATAFPSLLPCPVICRGSQGNLMRKFSFTPKLQWGEWDGLRRVRGRGGGEYRELLNSSWGWPTTPWCVYELSEPRIELRFVWLARLAVCFNFLPYSAFCTPWDSNIWPVVSPPSVFCQLTLLAFEVGTFRSELFYSLLSSITPTLPLVLLLWLSIYAYAHMFK